jgi:hypothetical protein
MTSGPTQGGLSRFARDLGALLLVAASFLPRNSEAAEVSPEATGAKPVPTGPANHDHHVNLRHFNLPAISSSSSTRNHSNAFAASLADKPGVIGAIANDAVIVDNAVETLKAGWPFGDANFSLTTRGSINVSLRSILGDSRLSVDPLHNGGSIQLVIKKHF